MTTANGSFTVNLPVPPIPPVPPAPQIIYCFLCMRKGAFLNAQCIYRGTYLCGNCVRSLPEKMIIDEFPG